MHSERPTQTTDGDGTTRSQLLPERVVPRSSLLDNRLVQRYLWIAVWVLAATALILGILWIPVGYVVQSPGPTVDVLGTQGETTVLEFAQSGDEDEFVIPEDGGGKGQLRMVTVSSLGGPGTTARISDVVRAWFSPAQEVRRYSDLFAPETTAEDVRQAGAAQMQSSHSAASIAAMDYLGVPMQTTMVIEGAAPGGGADGVVEIGDVLLAITTPDGVRHPVNSPSVPFSVMEQTPPGSVVAVTVLRDGVEKTVEIVTQTAESLAAQTGSDDDSRSGGDDEDDSGNGDQGDSAELASQGSRMGIFLSADTTMPIDVTIHLERIGGPSAGLVFALGIIDELTPGGIVGDQTFAATGALDFAGNVVPIGGVKQKMYGAKRDGAEWFLVPAANCNAVVGDVPEGLTVIPVSTLREAVGVVEDIVEGDAADLPTCEATLK